MTKVDTTRFIRELDDEIRSKRLSSGAVKQVWDGFRTWRAVTGHESR
jgi:hypothetical protein